MLGDAVELFVALWQAVSVPGDRMGIVYFRTGVDTEPAANQPLADVETQAGQLIAHVRGQTTTLWDLTAMGGGLQTAVNTLDATWNATADPNRPGSIVLFSDGMQNVNPMVDPTTLAIEDDATITASSNVTPDGTVLDADLGKKVSSIGIGAGGAYETLMEDIATATGGVERFTNDPDDDLRQLFVEQLIDNLRDYSPQLVDYRSRTLLGQQWTESFGVNATATLVVFKLSWSRGAQMAFSVHKDGVDLSPHCEWIEGDFYRIATLDLPLELGSGIVEAAGDWQMEVSGEQGAHYEAAVIVDEAELGIRCAVGEGRSRVGNPLQVSVQLLWGNTPLVDPPPDRITAALVHPEQSVDTVLGSIPGEWRQRAITSGQPLLTEASRDAKFWSQVGEVHETVTLVGQGDGTYTATLPTPTVAGPYTVTFRVSGSHPRIGDYERLQTVTAVVRFDVASLEMSDIKLERAGRLEGVPLYAVHVRPRDEWGNLLGPGQAHLLTLTAGRVGVATEVVDHGDGGYTLRLLLPPKTRPRLDLQVGGQRLFDGDIGELRRLGARGRRKPKANRGQRDGCRR